MNKILQIAVFASLVLTSFSSIYGQRGRLVEHELLKEYSSEEVVGFFQENFSGYIDEEENSLFFEIATLFFKNLIDERNIAVYKVIYETVDFYGDETTASGVVLVPNQERWVCKKAFSLYGHGTIFNREGVVSRPENFRGEFMLPMMMSSINTICAVPDYYGLGDGPGFHHHNTAQTNGTSSIDILRAGRNLCDLLGVDYNNNLINMGYSEGGSASMAVARMIKEESLQDEFNITMLGCGSGAYDMSDISYDFIVNDDYYPAAAYVMYLLATCQDIYGNMFEPGDDFSYYLKSPYDQYFEDNILTQNGNISWLTTPWTQMFHADVITELRTNPDNPFRNCLKEGNTYDWNNPNLTFLYYCNTDKEVNPENSFKTIEVQRSKIPWWRFWDRFRIIGLDLALGNGIGDSHPSCALPSILAQVLLMQGKDGMSCEYIGGKQARNLQEIESGISYSSNEINFNSNSSKTTFTKIEGINLLENTAIEARSDGTIKLEEDGIFIFRAEDKDGNQQLFWNIKMQPNFVNTEDYDPILTNPMTTSTYLDLSLLEDEVTHVKLYDEGGNLVSTIETKKYENKLLIERTANMTEGEYTVEVATKNNVFPLRLKVEDNTLEGNGAFEISPNPTNGIAKVNLNNKDVNCLVEVYNSIGELVLTYRNRKTSSFSLDLSNFDKGYYLVKITEGKRSFIEKLIVQ